MKKIALSLGLAALAFAAHAQSAEVSASDRAATSAVAGFVNHPYHCSQMMGGGNDGDLLPASYNAALDASLREINAPVDQAFALLNARCAKRVAELRAQRGQQVSTLDHSGAR